MNLDEFLRRGNALLLAAFVCICGWRLNFPPAIILGCPMAAIALFGNASAVIPWATPARWMDKLVFGIADWGLRIDKEQASRTTWF